MQNFPPRWLRKYEHLGTSPYNINQDNAARARKTRPAVSFTMDANEGSCLDEAGV